MSYFKIGDRVKYDSFDGIVYTGTITRSHGDHLTWWVKWDSDNDELYISERLITIIDDSIESNNVKVINEITDYSGTIVEYKGGKYKLCKV